MGIEPTTLVLETNVLTNSNYSPWSNYRKKRNGNKKSATSFSSFARGVL